MAAPAIAAISRRALRARRADHADLRGHLGDPAAHHRPRDVEAGRLRMLRRDGRPGCGRLIGASGSGRARPRRGGSMSTYRLEKVFAPRSVVLCRRKPARNRSGAISCRTCARGDSGSHHLVNPKYPEIDGSPVREARRGRRRHGRSRIVTAPPPTVPGIIEALGRKGSRRRSIVTAGLGHGPARLSR